MNSVFYRWPTPMSDAGPVRCAAKNSVAGFFIVFWNHVQARFRRLTPLGRRRQRAGSQRDRRLLGGGSCYRRAFESPEGSSFAPLGKQKGTVLKTILKQFCLLEMRLAPHSTIGEVRKKSTIGEVRKKKVFLRTFAVAWHLQVLDRDPERPSDLCSFISAFGLFTRIVLFHYFLIEKSSIRAYS